MANYYSNTTLLECCKVLCPLYKFSFELHRHLMLYYLEVKLIWKIAYRYNSKQFHEICYWPLNNWTAYLVFAIYLKFWSTKLKVDCFSNTTRVIQYQIKSPRKICLRRQYMSHTTTTPIYYRVDRYWDTLRGKRAETQVTIYAIYDIPMSIDINIQPSMFKQIIRGFLGIFMTCYMVE